MSENEQIIISSKIDTKICVKSKLKSHLMLIIMWLLMNAFFVYLLFMQDIAFKYWFVAIPILGFDVLGILGVYNAISKELVRVADIGYVLTDKAIYCYHAGSYKNVTKISFEEISRFEKDKTDPTAFYLCSKDKSIKVEYLPNQTVWYTHIAKKVNFNNLEQK